MLEERAPGSETTKPPTAVDSLSALVTAIRWATVAIGLIWAATLKYSTEDLLLGLALVAYALFRTFRPVEYRRTGWLNLLSILVELATSLAVVVATSCWDSPYIFCLFTPVIAAGFAMGFWHAFRIAVAACICVGLASQLLDVSTGASSLFAWGGELFLTAVIASYGRRLRVHGDGTGTLTIDQLWRLNEANALLVSLNNLSHDLPVSFDFTDTVQNALSTVNEATKPDVSAVLLRDPLTANWNVALAEGARLPDTYTEDQLPTKVRDHLDSPKAELVSLSAENHGFFEGSRVGIYVPLRAGQRRIGLLAVEATSRTKFGPAELDLIQGLATPVALTIDNARWFERLRARGAAQERTRLARDLHDRVGQGVAYVAFELERLSEAAKGTDLEQSLADLRTDARSIVGELRETLYDLRTDVSDDHGFIETLGEFLDRVSMRSGIHTEIKNDAGHHLPLATEREVWRIAQEAIVNAERHADATKILVKWELEGPGAVLTVEDDGGGLSEDGTSGSYSDSDSPGRPAYGLTGMRERADSIGALLEMESGSKGTIVRLSIGGRRAGDPPLTADKRLKEPAEHE